jgi:RNA:NAD 2'-phosphotransferase (TPT1/KptA family)
MKMRRNPDFGYHGTNMEALPALLRQGLRSEAGPDKQVYFARYASDALGYTDYDPLLLRFPWPDDTRPSGDGWSWATDGVPPEEIEIWFGWAEDEDDPYDSHVRGGRFEAWRPLTPSNVKAYRAFMRRRWRRADERERARRENERARREKRNPTATYWHVTEASNVPNILRNGLRAGDGICGSGVYLFDSREAAVSSLDDFGFDVPVLLAVQPNGTDRLSRCAPADYAGEGDSDYYEHVLLKRMRRGALWRPVSVRQVR